MLRPDAPAGAKESRHENPPHPPLPFIRHARPGAAPVRMLSRRRLLGGVPALALAGCATRPPPPPAPPAPVPPGMAARLDDAMRTRPLVLLGEMHDNATQHALRAEALRRRLAAGARPALLMEQFDRERQRALDAVLARPGATVDALIAAGWPEGRAGWDWALYRPYLALVFEYALPLEAANVSRTDARRIAADGLAAAGFDAELPPDIAAAQRAAIVDGHCGRLDDAAAGRLLLAQVARDQFMARRLAAHATRGAVLLAGNGHVRRDIGVPRWLPPALRPRSLAIGLLEEGAEAERTAYDLALVTPGPARGDACASMRLPAG